MTIWPAFYGDADWSYSSVYNIYDLELTEVNNNSELRKLLIKTTPKSIIVIEDIDCSIDLTSRNRNGCISGDGCKSGGSGSYYDGGGSDDGGNRITLSGLLNFTDGVWSCCGSERIFVFTTNHIDRLDRALLRSGRMDMHIHMSYCSFPALKILVKKLYWIRGVRFGEGGVGGIGGGYRRGQMTPAEISEILIRNRRNKSKAVVELAEKARFSADL